MGGRPDLDRCEDCGGVVDIIERTTHSVVTQCRVCGREDETVGHEDDQEDD